MKNLKLAMILFVAVVLVACASKRKTEPKSDVPVMNVSVEEDMVSEYQQERDKVSEKADKAEFTLEKIHFEYDSYALSDDARKILEKNANIIKLKDETGRVKVYVEGHCDERGTISYNIALGQKRATEVKNYYTNLGIKAKDIETISYGEEKPICFESNKSCWLANRRSETKLTVF